MNNSVSVRVKAESLSEVRFDLFLGAADERDPDVLPEALVPEAVDERAEEARDQDEAEVVEEGDVLRQPVGVQNKEGLGEGAGEGQHAQQQLEAVQQHRVQSFAHGRSVLPQFSGFQQNPHVGEEDDDSHHREVEHAHCSSEEGLRWGGVDHRRFTNHRGGEDVHSRVLSPDAKLGDGEGEADEPHAQSDDPDPIRAPESRGMQRVDDGNVPLQWHGSQDQVSVLKGASGHKEQRDAEQKGKSELTHDAEEEQHRGQDLQGVVDEHVSEQDVTGRVQKVPVRGKGVQHDSNAAEEEAEEGGDHTHLDNHWGFLWGCIDRKRSQVLHRDGETPTKTSRLKK